MKSNRQTCAHTNGLNVDMCMCIHVRPATFFLNVDQTRNLMPKLAYTTVCGYLNFHRLSKAETALLVALQKQRQNKILMCSRTWTHQLWQWEVRYRQNCVTISHTFNPPCLDKIIIPFPELIM